MSVFQTINLACPDCGANNSFDAVQSVNADRRSDLRDAILDETFQSKTCDRCGKSFRLMPRLNYLDVARDQWFAAHPIEEMKQWQEIEAEDQAAFDRAYGDLAATTARRIGASLKVRITFGWPGLREKILADEHQLDDVTLELVKIAILRGVDGQPLGDNTELRLVDVLPGVLVLAWIDLRTEAVVEMMEAPRQLYEEIHADSEGWMELRALLTDVLYVDANRLIVAGGPEMELAGDMEIDDETTTV